MTEGMPRREDILNCYEGWAPHREPNLLCLIFSSFCGKTKEGDGGDFLEKTLTFYLACAGAALVGLGGGSEFHIPNSQGCPGGAHKEGEKVSDQGKPGPLKSCSWHQNVPGEPAHSPAHLQ